MVFDSVRTLGNFEKTGTIFRFEITQAGEDSFELRIDRGATFELFHFSASQLKELRNMIDLACDTAFRPG